MACALEEAQLRSENAFFEIGKHSILHNIRCHKSDVFVDARSRADEKSFRGIQSNARHSGILDTELTATSCDIGIFCGSFIDARVEGNVYGRYLAQDQDRHTTPINQGIQYISIFFLAPRFPAPNFFTPTSWPSLLVVKLQGVYVNFANIISSTRRRLPLGVGQAILHTHTRTHTSHTT